MSRRWPRSAWRASSGRERRSARWPNTSGSTLDRGARVGESRQPEPMRGPGAGEDSDGAATLADAALDGDRRALAQLLTAVENRTPLAEVRKAGRAVAVIAVDPSSPITGGALLGDRVRMQSYAGDRDVFIRSMAARGHAGGLASTTGAATAVLDAAGFDLVLIETVGTGQSEVEVAA